jgi:Fibronectin type III domain
VPTVIVVGCTGQVAQASFSSAASASATYSTSTLQPPSNVSATCTRAGAGSPSTATVTWTATTSPYATGYVVSWTGATSGSVNISSSPATIGNMTKNTDYTFTVAATYRNWTSTAVPSGIANC